MSNSTTLESVARDEKGRVKGGALNPGGMTKEARVARDLLNADLRDPLVYADWLLAYREQIKIGNVVILKDYADRIGGKPKEYVELSSDPDAPVNPHAPLSLDELKAVARAQLEKEKAK